MIHRLKHWVYVAAVKAIRAYRRVILGLGDVSFYVDRYWTDERHRAVEGCATAAEKIEDVEIRVHRDWIKPERIDPLHGDDGAEVGRSFALHAAHDEPIALHVRVKRKGRWTRHLYKQPVPDCAERLDVPDASDLFEDFVREVNERHLHVLEIGSRIVSPGSSSERRRFPDAGSYTGFDYYPDENTDIVGDAHRLSEFVEDRKFDAVFSIAVFEHLAMPWVVASEINRVLKPGGITYHGTVFSWPAHERPWDFWRLSDEGLKVLFSPALGYEVLGAGMFDPVSIHFRKRREGHGRFPHAAAYASAAILARKKEDVDADRFRWPADLTGFLGADSHYPEAEPRREG